MYLTLKKNVYCPLRIRRERENGQTIRHGTRQCWARKTTAFHIRKYGWVHAGTLRTQCIGNTRTTKRSAPHEYACAFPPLCHTYIQYLYEFLEVLTSPPGTEGRTAQQPSSRPPLAIRNECRLFARTQWTRKMTCFSGTVPQMRERLRFGQQCRCMWLRTCDGSDNAATHSLRIVWTRRVEMRRDDTMILGSRDDRIGCRRMDTGTCAFMSSTHICTYL